MFRKDFSVFSAVKCAVKYFFLFALWNTKYKEAPGELPALSC